jgi:hypothetical protein
MVSAYLKLISATLRFPSSRSESYSRHGWRAHAAQFGNIAEVELKFPAGSETVIESELTLPEMQDFWRVSDLANPFAISR